MQSHRVEVVGRGSTLVIAHRGLLLPSELKSALPPTEACTQLDHLPATSLETLVDEWGYRFPNTVEPAKSLRVLGYVRERVASGALSVVRRG